MTHFQRHWFFVNLSFTKEDKILIKNLIELEGYNASQRVFQKKPKCHQHLQVVAIAMGYTGWSTVPAVADDAALALILLMNWCYTQKWLVEK